MAQSKATGKAMTNTKQAKPNRNQVGSEPRQSAEPEEGIGEEQELVLSDELGGGDSFMPCALPAGKYVIAGGGVVIWPLRRGEAGDFDALFPLQTLLGLEAHHEPRLVRRVSWGPESTVETPWTIVTVDGIAVLVRPDELTVYNECDVEI